jgi:hypothetical protein
VVGMVIGDRIRRLEERLAGMQAAAPGAGDAPRTEPAAPGDHVLPALRESAPAPADRFGWMRDQTGSMQVFLPVLLGAGVLASALAWAVEHLARATVTPTFESRLAGRLRYLSLPPGGLLGEPSVDDPPQLSRGRSLMVVPALALGAVGVFLGIDALADMTQSRPDVLDADARTVFDVALNGELADRNPERVAGHLWTACTSPDVFRSRQLPAPAMEHGQDGVVRIVVDTDVGAHGIDRLEGCLNDVTLDKVRASVLAVSVG